MSDLLPCPFCGHEITEDWGDSTWSGFSKWRYCRECQAQGPHMHSRRGEGSDECQARADEAWNTRVDFAAERERKLVEALKTLDHAVTEIIRYGAQTGPQWSRLTSASLKARATLKEDDDE